MGTSRGRLCEPCWRDMPAYVPGQGLSKEALERLRNRKTQASGIADLPAVDASKQWEQVIGDGARKKVRCGICTRPLGEQEQAEKRLVCDTCAAASADQSAPRHRDSLAKEELGVLVMYRYMLARGSTMA